MSRVEGDDVCERSRLNRLRRGCELGIQIRLKLSVEHQSLRLANLVPVLELAGSAGSEPAIALRTRAAVATSVAIGPAVS